MRIYLNLITDLEKLVLLSSVVLHVVVGRLHGLVSALGIALQGARLVLDKLGSQTFCGDLDHLLVVVFRDFCFAAHEPEELVLNTQGKLPAGVDDGSAGVVGFH